MEPTFAITLLHQIFSWRAIIDIFLMASGLFVLYRTLLGLGTWKIVTGILIAIVFFLIANLLDLKGIEWVFNNISQVAVIALIIIFQPEIRKLLERTASFRRAKTAKGGDELSTILSEAAFMMAQRRQGAIIVLPGKDPLEEWLAGGHALEARPSIPLILSIFDPNSPGHDGAVIADHGKLTRFGARLPLSQSAVLTEDFGTRHHAAMGLAERSDALAIVVSEERGQVSIFHDGRMRPVASRQQLGDIVLTHWETTASYQLDLPGTKARRFAFVQILTCLAVAVLFYATLIIAQGEMLEKVLTVPVEYTASPSNLVLVGDKNKEARLHLSGRKSDLDSVETAQINVKIDLSKAVAGKQTFLITIDNLKLPRGVRLLDVTPHSIELELAEIIEQEMTVKPQLVGKLPAGLKIRSIEITPEKIKALSPVTAKKGASPIVMTTPIYLDSLTDDATLFCKIIALPSIHPVDKRWPDVQVTISMERK